MVRVTDAGTASELNGLPYMVMELLEGRDLCEQIGIAGRMPAAQVATVVHQAADALGKAHDGGIIHRDLKPSNLFIHTGGKRPIVKVLDFGISKFSYDDPSVDPALTTVGALIGTPLYMAPEQVRRENDSLTPGVDVWAMGMIAFELLAGRRYWSSVNDAGEMRGAVEVQSDILRAPLPKPSDLEPSLPKAFDDWFSIACDRDVTNRFATVGEQSEALAKALGVASLPEVRLDDAPDAPLFETDQQLISTAAIERDVPDSEAAVAMARVKPASDRPEDVPASDPASSTEQRPADVAEILGTCQSVGCTVDKTHPHDKIDEIKEGVLTIPVSASFPACTLAYLYLFQNTHHVTPHLSSIEIHK